MFLSDYHKKVINAEICPYCKSEVKQLSEFDIYGTIFKDRKIYACVNYPKCDSYVGSHKNGKPLGRLANKSLREYKSLAHKEFDKIWKEKHIERAQAYEAMSIFLNIPIEYTHIGMFKIDTCKSVIKWSKEYYNKIN